MSTSGGCSSNRRYCCTAHPARSTTRFPYCCRLFLFTSYHAQQQQQEATASTDERAAELIEQVGMCAAQGGDVRRRAALAVASCQPAGQHRHQVLIARLAPHTQSCCCHCRPRRCRLSSRRLWYSRTCTASWSTSHAASTHAWCRWVVGAGPAPPCAGQAPKDNSAIAASTLASFRGSLSPDRCACLVLHLLQQQDRRPSAAALEDSWNRLRQQRQQQQQPPQGPGSGLSGLHSSSGQAQQRGGQGVLVSQQRLRQLLQEQLGYSLTVRPSNIEHQDAGVCVGWLLSVLQHPSSNGGTCRVSGSTASSTTHLCSLWGQLHCVHMCGVLSALCVCVPGLGLFVEGEVPPGSLIALFPGLVYGKEVHK